ncbi:sterol desaturase family protein [Zymomonas mobilis]|uniref:Fatty acid hydroxylase n=1 Tax=Zymomonas mobilis subsp. mobilis (strain ATCC 10988 / DSM 424 / LMG 404 / NCIMB 8938 / NRRL B-806 / ZM1) TaxID=555217 RepID=A0A0H3G0G8_ZYMMA|nr:sterol desaturase family protein [Zymomonas mobilis]AEH63521.1 fatty acid hydroxylase [Zymomonas mobilis subsp. mobilis ATCC 10988]TQL26864.1 fatty acid hydroxylase family protein [Zymomonas mobilis]TQL30510.1 fatty acid hydroxylase family protein [Zymomonas mobilis]
MNTTDAKTLKTASRFWKKSHYLGRMTLKELVVVYFQYYTILTYLTLAAVMIGLYIWKPAPLLPTIASIAVAILGFPLVWYVTHRWIMHGHWMFKVPFLSGLWKRIHYDHHLDPDHLEVLFGALYTTLPSVALATALPGYLIGGFGGACIGYAVGLLSTCFYEFCHCIQRLGYKPKNKRLALMKKRHLEHHFHDEDGNFGITNFFWDKLLGTYYVRRERPNKSSTVFNLGYTPEIAKKYPWVAEHSGGEVLCSPKEKDRYKSSFEEVDKIQDIR